MSGSVIATRILIFTLCVVGCGGGDDDSETRGERLCRQVVDKLDSCNLELQASTRCNEDAAEAVLCAAQCAIDAPCGELTTMGSETTYMRCVATCSGAGPEDFICDDGAGFLPAAGVCDGVSQCPDGSDEAQCGGPTDAGTD
jgi:hypothetical protein